MERSSSGTNARDLRLRRERSISAVVLAVFSALTASIPAKADTSITFDDTLGLAPVSFAAAWPGGEFGPDLESEGALISGGVIALAVTPANQAATTPPNFYATTDFQPLADGTVLSGIISADLSEPATSVSLDVGNGHLFPAEFTLTAFDDQSVVATDSVVLAPFASASGFVGTLSVTAQSISRFEVTSNQGAGFTNFVVDSVEIQSLPEPAMATGVLIGAAAILIARRQRLS